MFENIIWNTTKEMWWGIETKMQRSTNLYWISFELKRSSEFQYIVGIGCCFSTSIDEIFERWFRYGTWNVWLKRANKLGENVFIYSVCRCQHCKNLTQNYDENILFDNYSFIENQRKKKWLLKPTSSRSWANFSQNAFCPTTPTTKPNTPGKRASVNWVACKANQNRCYYFYEQRHWFRI